MQEGEGCPVTRIYAIRSGVPLIGMGVILVLAGGLGLLVPQTFRIGTVPALVFAGFGIFLIWLGIAK